MLTLLFTACIYQIAEFDKRRGWLWALSSFVFSVLLQSFLIAGYWGAVLGFLLSLAAMIYANIKYPVNKGPTLGRPQ